MRFLVGLLMLGCVSAIAMTETGAQQVTGQPSEATGQPVEVPSQAAQPPDIDELMTAIYVLFGFVLIGMPLYSTAVRVWASGGTEPVGPRAFNLPNGSIRAMLGLLTVGTFVLVLAYGLSFSQGSSPFFGQVITAFATLAGSVTGFYFGGRSAAPAPPAAGAGAAGGGAAGGQPAA